jgi:hypothetical protein
MYSAQCLYEQEAQRGHILTDRGWSQLLRLEQMSLILPNLLGPELVRWLGKMLRKIADDANVWAAFTIAGGTQLTKVRSEKSPKCPTVGRYSHQRIRLN